MNKLLQFFNHLVKSKNLKYGTASLIMIAFVVAIAVILNLIVDMLNIKWDLTPNKLYSLSEESKQILEKLEKDVVIYGLFDEGKVGANDEYHEVVNLLEQYDKYDRVTVEYVDIDRNPDFVTKIDPDDVLDLSHREFVVKCGDKVKKLEYYDLFRTTFDQYSFQVYKTGSNAEQGFTGAIKYVTADVTPTIYFIEGHGEIGVDSGFTTIKTILERNNFAVKTLNVLTAGGVPEDATIIVFLSPSRDLLLEEREKIQEYLFNGGKAMMFFDPLQTNVAFTEFNKLLEEFNVFLNNDSVKENDASRHLPNNEFALVPQLKQNTVNSALSPNSFLMVMEKARSMEILKNEKTYITVYPLVVTSETAESLNVESQENNKTGELNLAVAVDYKGGMGDTKIVVVGDSNFFSDTASQYYGPNGVYFFLNNLTWMYQPKDDIFIAPKKYESQYISISASQRNLFTILLVVVLPLLIFAVGTVVYIRRRHL